MAMFRHRPIAVGLFAALIWQAASADPLPPDQGDAIPAAAGEIQDVIVTSEKRSENIQKVPISISVVSGDAIEEQHIRNYEDISRTTPGVSFNQEGGAEGLNNIVIRGISSTSGSSTVGIYLDDVSITVPNFFDGATQPRLFDLDRVEVLRGPQGTLYGASSEGGTIRFITKQPDMYKTSSEFLSDLSGTVHGGLNYQEGGAVSIPIVPGVFAVRASLDYVDQSGYIDNYNYFNTGEQLHNGVNGEHALSGRINGRIVVDTDTIITPGLFFQRDKFDDNSAFYPALGLWKQSKQVDEYGRDDLFLPSLTIEHDLGFADLTSVSGYFYRDFQRQQDGTYYNSQLFATAFLDPLYPQNQAINDAKIGTLRSPVNYQTTYQQVSQEVRLASHPYENLPLRWVAGLYYADLFMNNHDYQLIPGINSTFQSIYGFPIEQSLVAPAYGQGVSPLFPNDSDQAVENTYDVRQYAIFGQVDYDILPSLHAAAGARYLIARSNVNFTSSGFYEIGNPTPFNKTVDNYALTPKFSLTYDVAAENNIYASIAKGYRLGGPQPSPTPFGPNSVCNGDFNNIGVTNDPVAFGSDKLWTYELGSKNRFDDNRLTVNADVYYTQWYNVQQQIPLPTCGFAFTANIGNAEVYGSEIEIAWRPLKGLTLGANASYQHAAIVSSNNPQTAAVGQRLIDVPEYTYVLSAGYERAIDDETSLFVQGSYAWTGNSYGSYQVANSNYKNPGYGSLNASAGFRRQMYDVSLYATNLSDDRTILQRPMINSVIEGYTQRPLTVGVQLRVRL